MILVDTGPLVALCEPRDSLNHRAREDFKSFKNEQVLVPLVVVAEAAFHLRLPVQRERMRIFIDTHASLLVADDQPEVLDEVFDWLEQYAEHEPDWVDGQLVVLCGRNHKLKVWTYDTEFKDIWRRPDGSHIPLAVKL